MLTHPCAARAAHGGEAPPIRLNTVGYLPDARKQASVSGAFETFTVVRIEDGGVAFSGSAQGPVHNADTGEDLHVADFSALDARGDYRLEIDGLGSSAPFRIAGDVFRDAFRLATRAMYLWRCGTAVRGEHGGDVFSFEACHLEDAWTEFIDGEHARRDATGGWHDAGDYNKYVTNAGVTVGVMLRAWEDFGDRIAAIDLGIPESGGAIPDFLAEIKWKTDWLLKMQAEDGRVFHKVSTIDFGGFIMPDEEKTPRYIVPWGSGATADFVAMLAAMARAIEPYDAPYAARCLEAARKSHAFLRAHPDDHAPRQEDFKTGGYASPDDDERLWAAVEMWATTGDVEALADAEARIRAVGGEVEFTFDWAAVRNLGLFTYALSTREGRDPALSGQVRESLLRTADSIVAAAKAHGYARPLGERYSWGGNGGVARQAVTLRAAHRVSPNPEYIAAARDAIDHLLGRNVHGRSYVTGLGDHPPLHPHDRRSGGDKVEAPWPGYLVGGPNPGARDWFDVEGDYRTNEIAINWNAALIYALAAELPGGAEE